MHGILIIIDPQDGKCRDLSKEDRDEFVCNICERVQDHVAEENNDIFGTVDRRFVSDKHDLIFKELKEVILELPNVKFPLQSKYTLGSLDLVNLVIKLHNAYANEGGVKAEICGTNYNYEALIMAMTLKSLIQDIEVEFNVRCISENIEESIPFAKSIGINVIDL